MTLFGLQLARDPRSPQATIKQEGIAASWKYGDADTI